MRYEVRDTTDKTVAIFEDRSEAMMYATDRNFRVVEVTEQNSLKEEVRITQPSFLTE